jgi:hypothetical protein
MHVKNPAPGSEDDRATVSGDRRRDDVREAELTRCEHGLSTGYRCHLRAEHSGLHYWRSDDHTRDFSWG